MKTIPKNTVNEAIFVPIWMEISQQGRTFCQHHETVAGLVFSFKNNENKQIPKQNIIPPDKSCHLSLVKLLFQYFLSRSMCPVYHNLCTNLHHNNDNLFVNIILFVICNNTRWLCQCTFHPCTSASHLDIQHDQLTSVINLTHLRLNVARIQITTN